MTAAAKKTGSQLEPQQKPDTTEYQHSILCALTLPRSKQTSRDYQGRSLILEAGRIFNRRELIEQPLPYGAKVRLAFMHICSEAVKRQSPFVEIEQSATAFMEK